MKHRVGGYISTFILAVGFSGVVATNAYAQSHEIALSGMVPNGDFSQEYSFPAFDDECGKKQLVFVRINTGDKGITVEEKLRHNRADNDSSSACITMTGNISLSIPDAGILLANDVSNQNCQSLSGEAGSPSDPVQINHSTIVSVADGFDPRMILYAFQHDLSGFYGTGNIPLVFSSNLTSVTNPNYGLTAYLGRKLSGKLIVDYGYAVVNEDASCGGPEAPAGKDQASSPSTAASPKRGAQPSLGASQ